MEKIYSNASNARRAAKAAGLVDFAVYKSGDGYKVAAAPEPAKAPKVAKAKTARTKSAAVAKTPKKAKAPKGAKGAQLIAMVTRGATISELMETLGWQQHTTRGAISRLGKDWGYDIQRTKVGNADDGFESHYKIAS